MQRIPSVSYTHLDVYKRQVWDREETGDWAGNIKGVDDWLFDLEQKKKQDKKQDKGEETDGEAKL